MRSGLFSVSVLGSAVLLLWLVDSKSLRYQAPDECKWYSVRANGEEEEVSDGTPDNQEVALVCRVRTINSEIEKTNFSVIQPQYTVKLKIVCGETFFFKSSVNAGSFQTLIDLRDLSIEFCKIDNLVAGAFRGMRQLRKLTFVTHNDDWAGTSLHVSPDVFANELHLLQRLDLSCNNIGTLPEGVFCPLHSLAFLNLTCNKLHSLEMLQFGCSAKDAPQCGANLRVLDLSNNSIQVLSHKVFSNLVQLQELHLQENSISVISDHAFDNVSSLSVLKLAHNKLVSLPPELFTYCRHLKEVHLQNNLLNTLAAGLFDGLAKLLVLDLSNNQLTHESINSATLTGLAALFMLNLSNNNITKLDAFMFDRLHQLRVLRLENNLIHSIPLNAFSSLDQLNTLVLSNNKLKQVDSFTFDGLSGLVFLALDNNQIGSIGEQAFGDFTNLVDLHLNSNLLKDIPTALKNILNLKTLDLGNNQIDILSTSFPPMSQLVGLRLTENNISRVPKGVFDQLNELQIINLSNNKIQKIEQGTFDATLKVVAIRIDGNYLTDVEGLFSKLPNLVWLNISENLLQWFDYAMIPIGLQWLDIHSNNIVELGNHFEIENQLQLSVFDASNNRLTEITGSSIPDNVQSLNLANNHISKIQSYTFFKKFNLTRINLSGNRLNTLTPHSLRISPIAGDKPLPEFLISGNPFECDCTMQWLQSYSVEPDRNKPLLTDLDEVKCELLYNRHNYSVVPLKEATADQFLCRYELECAKRSICDCCDFDACDCKVVCPSNCTCYHSMSASANVVSCTRAGYHGNIPEKIPMNVTQLYLDGNNIPLLSSHALLGRKLLKVLFLNGSNIEVVSNRTFYGLRDLQVLRLDNNRISLLKGNEFEGLDQLKELYLHQNRISSIESDVLTTLHTLGVLRLHHNHLSHFSIWKLPLSLASVSLADNPWSCECQFVQKMQQYLMQYLKSVVVDSHNMRCLNSSVLEYSVPIMSHNISLFCTQQSSVVLTKISSNMIEGPLNSNLTVTNSAARPDLHHYLLPVTVVTICVVLFFCILSLLVCVYKDELRIWFYSKFGVRLFYPSNEVEMDDRDKLYDAFVSYSAKDEIFVAEELAPMLENGEPSYKLCLHYREFPVGGYLSDTIVQAVESSRRTIMVVSENFLKSEWSDYEFRSAHHQVLRNRCKRVIVILLGDVLPSDLDPHLKLYLNNNTYLQWGEKLFWERLRFALPDVPNNQRYKYNRHRHMGIHRHVSAHYPHLHHHHLLNRHHNNCNQNAPNNRSVAIHI